MQPSSRDDFIIAIRSAFLKKENKQKFSLSALIILTLSILILGKDMILKLLIMQNYL